jgi:protein SCO1/2
MQLTRYFPMFKIKSAKAAIVVALLTLCSASSYAAMPVLFDAPKFELTNQDGQPFKSEQMAGKIWIADFLFTSCPHECPMMTAAKKRLSDKFKDQSKLHFVSITTDPKTDSPAVLKKFGDKYKVDFNRWHLLTGDKKKIVGISQDGFKLPASIDKPSHSQRFVLIDEKGKVRGYYESESKEDQEKLASDIKSLL